MRLKKAHDLATESLLDLAIHNQNNATASNASLLSKMNSMQ